MNLQQFLQQRHVPFQRVAHRTTYTAQNLAQAVHVSGEMVAKTVLLWADECYVLAVLPATHSVDLHRLAKILPAESVELASEIECGHKFADCELGALPPFGSLYGIRTIVDESLTQDEEIVFEGNSHQEAIRMKYADFEELEQPQVASFAHHL